MSSLYPASFKRFFVLLMVAVLPALAPATAPAAKPGDLHLVNGLPMPTGAIPAASSGTNYRVPSISDMTPDGRYVVFTSDAEVLAPGSNPNVINVYRKDRLTGEIVLVSRENGPDGPGIAREAAFPKISADGNLVAFLTDARLSPADTNNGYDIYVRNIAAGTTTPATPGLTTGVNFGFDLSADGRYIAFATRDDLTGSTPGVSDTNNDDDIYRRELSEGSSYELVSVNSAGSDAGQGSDPFHSSMNPSISGDGRWVAFQSQAKDLIEEDENAVPGSGPWPVHQAAPVTRAFRIIRTGP